MSEITVTTNNIPRPIVSYFELTESQQKSVASDYDYTDCTELSYFIYKSQVYSLDDFMRVGYGMGHSNDHPLSNWDGYSQVYGFLGGLVIKLTDCGEGVIVGVY